LSGTVHIHLIAWNAAWFLANWNGVSNSYRVEPKGPRLIDYTKLPPPIRRRRDGACQPTASAGPLGRRSKPISEHNREHNRWR
jgi:hypothetical protein